MLQRAASEPHVSIEYAGTGPARFDSLRGLARPLGRIIVAARSSLLEKTNSLRARSVASLKMPYGSGDDDRVRVAILMTDIVGSTKLVVEMGDKDWRVLLDRHDHAIRCQIRRFGGSEVANRGDGFVGLFDTPARAVCCATAIADSVASLGLSLRCGIHFGEVNSKRNKISGVTAHITARIAAMARPGEAFVSQMVRDLVTESDLVFEDRGVHRLRDLPEEIQLYAVRAVVRR
jgi:class 3 adenylate cyclase